MGRLRRSIALHRLLLIAAVFASWEAAAQARWLDAAFVSRPSEVLSALGGMAANERLVAAAGVTATQIVYAFALAACVGILLGAAIGLSTFAYRTFGPVILLLFGLPKMVMLPLFILFFGIGIVSKSVFAFSLGVFPILLNVMAGVRMVDPTLLAAAESMGASRVDMVFKVVLPSALPTVITGLRLGMSQTVLGVLLAELYGASTGIGFFVAQYTQSFKSAQVFALFFVVASLAILVNEGLRVLEVRAGQWREENAAEAVV
jgi:NitT/TauT family transport system permease protein